MRRSAGLEKWWIAGALAVLLAAGSAQAQDPVKGGTLVVARVADIFTFDPYNTQDDRSIFTELTIYDRLVKLSPDGKKRRAGAGHGLDGRPRRADGRFHPAGWREVLRRVAADRRGCRLLAVAGDRPEGLVGVPVLSRSSRSTKVDDKTVRLTMSEPFAPLLPALSTFAASIYQKANFEKQGEEAGEHPLGTGAFMLDHLGQGAAGRAEAQSELLAGGQALSRRGRSSVSSATTTPGRSSSPRARSS